MEYININPQEITADEDNPNEMSEDNYNHLKREIRKRGFIDPVTVKEENGKYKLIDGEHRWNVAKEMELKEIPAVNLGQVSDEEAKETLVNLNRIRGEFNPVRFAKLLEKLDQKKDPKEVLKRLNMSEKERNSYRLMRELNEMPELPKRETTTTKKAYFKGKLTSGEIKGVFNIEMTNEAGDVYVEVEGKDISHKVKAIKVDCDKEKKSPEVQIETK